MYRQTKDVLLVKDSVGHAKPTTRDLPPSDFAYGKCEEGDPEGVSQSNCLLIHSHSKLAVSNPDW